MTVPNSVRGEPGRFGAVALVALGALAVALVSQHVFGMEPCPWCVLQRAILLPIAIAAGIGSVWRGATGRRIAAFAAALLAVGGMAAALWQHFRAAASASCNLTLADRIVGALRLDSALPAVFEARASCADAAVKLLGVPYDVWSFALFVLLAAATARLVSRPRARGFR